jgi:hypothetical protein
MATRMVQTWSGLGFLVDPQVGQVGWSFSVT